MQTPIKYIQSKGWEFKQQSGQLILKTCPFCDDEKWHFYINPDEAGPYFCHRCNTKGSLWTLKKHLGDIQPSPIRLAFQKPVFKKPQQDQAEKYHQSLLGDPEAITYLEDRGITQESIKRFNLGLYRQNGTSWLSIPHYQNKELANIKFRSFPPAKKTFKRISGCKSILFNTDAIHNQKELFIAEGELDAITLIQEGIENVVSGTTGAGSFDPEWFDQLKTVVKIYICYDADEAGQRGARSLAKRLGYSRCFNIDLPENQDINDYFNSGQDGADFQQLIQKAHKFDLPGVVSLDTAIGLLKTQQEQGEADQGLLTPWSNVNRLTKGFHPGDLIIVSAPPKIGKTSWCLDITRSLILENVPVLFYCLEMRPERLVKKLLQAEFREKALGEYTFFNAHNRFTNKPLYFAYSFKKEKLEDLIQLIRDAIKRYDLKLVVFDNLHFFCRSVTHVNEEIGQVVQSFKLLAEEMEIPIIVVAQPRKRESGSRDEIMRADDIKYSNAVHSDCDQMILLHRKRVASRAHELESGEFVAKEEALDPVTLVRVEAHRYGSGGEALLYFHGEYSRFDLLDSAKQGD